MSIIPEPDYIGGMTRVDDLGRIQIPKEMRKKLGVVEGDWLRLTATGNIIVIENVIEKYEENEVRAYGNM